MATLTFAQLFHDLNEGQRQFHGSTVVVIVILLIAALLSGDSCSEMVCRDCAYKKVSRSSSHVIELAGFKMF